MSNIVRQREAETKDRTLNTIRTEWCPNCTQGPKPCARFERAEAPYGRWRNVFIRRIGLAAQPALVIVRCGAFEVRPSPSGFCKDPRQVALL